MRRTLTALALTATIVTLNIAVGQHQGSVVSKRASAAGTVGTVSHRLFENPSQGVLVPVECGVTTHVGLIRVELWQQITGPAYGNATDQVRLGTQPLWEHQWPTPSQLVSGERRIAVYYQWVVFNGSYLFTAKITAGGQSTVDQCHLTKA